MKYLAIALLLYVCISILCVFFGALFRANFPERPKPTKLKHLALLLALGFSLAFAPAAQAQSNARCVLALVAACHVDKAQIAVNVFSVATTFADTAKTQANARLFGSTFKEYNPLARPFETHGAAVAYASASVETFASSWLADRLKNSHNRVARKLWWLPQLAIAGGHIAAMEVSR